MNTVGDVWLVKYDGTCARCGVVLLRGTPAVWDRASRTIRCIECPTTAGSAAPAATPSPPDSIGRGVAGHSARVEHDRREALRDAAITSGWGTGFLSRVVRAVSVEPQSTRAWAIGALGEERLAAELDKVGDLRMLHDRRVPGTRANIDHIVIGPAGVFVVDAKNHSGRIEIEDRGGWFRTDYRLLVGRRDKSALADASLRQAEIVRSALADHGADPLPPIVPVLCFLSVEWPLFRPPESFRGVRLEGPKSLRRLVYANEVLSPEQADHIMAVLAGALPPR